MNNADIGIIGLAVMGENLVLNMESKGFTVAIYNRTVSKVDDFLAGRGRGRRIIGCHSVEQLCASLAKPAKIMLMVKAGAPVDEFIAQLLPHLNQRDIIIDGGNSHFPDTIRRCKELESKGFLYVGTGVSGGEEGALSGPSIMPGGSAEAWLSVKPIFQSIAARTPDGQPCCEWVGDNGAGHFVKMVHNGIEYGDMQIICETYHLMKHGLRLTNDQMSQAFGEWNEAELDSYLIEITRDILAYKENGEYVLDTILDAAGQKGTGKWTALEALDLGEPVTLIVEAVFARCLSAMKEQRVQASKNLRAPKSSMTLDKQSFLEDLRKALYAAKITSYAQGFMLLQAAASEYGWRLDYGTIALLWQGGCIIRSAFLGKIKEAFQNDPGLANLMLYPFFREIIGSSQDSWRRVISTAVCLGIPVPAMSAALAFYDGYRSEWLPANLLQAQRDYFGAHTYERVDRPRGEHHHTNWTGKGGATSASTYTA